MQLNLGMTAEESPCAHYWRMWVPFSNNIGHSKVLCGFMGRLAGCGASQGRFQLGAIIPQQVIICRNLAFTRMAITSSYEVRLG